MGCDIHPAIQVKGEDSRAWMTVGHPSDTRWYAFFEMLTGQRARNDFAGVLPAHRGLPADLGENYGYDPEEEHRFGDHSQTWFTLAEMKSARDAAKAFDESMEEFFRGTLERYDSWIRLAEELGRQHEAKSDDDVRFVIGYDS